MAHHPLRSDGAQRLGFGTATVRRSLVLSLTVLTAFGAGAFWYLNTRSENAQPEVGSPMRQTVFPGAQYGESPYPGAKEEIAGLRERLARLETEIAGLRRERKADVMRVQSHGDTMGTQGDAEELSNTVEQQLAAELEAAKRRNVAYLESIESTYNSEKTDGAWAQQAAAEITAALSPEEGATLAQASVQEVECRLSLCRVEVSLAGRGRMDEFLHRFHPKVAHLLPRLTIQPFERGGDSATFVIYLAREGHRFPDPETTAP